MVLIAVTLVYDTVYDSEILEGEDKCFSLTCSQSIIVDTNLTVGWVNAKSTYVVYESLA